jgi:hypothetical protein
MTITANDLKFLASQRFNDDPDGGGLPTASVVQDGVENNVFPDIGTLDRAQGRLQLRKVYPACLSLTQDTYIGAHVIVDDGPDDSNVDVFMFMFGKLTTLRSEAEAYLGAISGEFGVLVSASGLAYALNGPPSDALISLADYKANNGAFQVGSYIDVRLTGYGTEYISVPITSVYRYDANTYAIRFRGYFAQAETHPIIGVRIKPSASAILRGISLLASGAAAAATSVTVARPTVKTGFSQQAAVFHVYVPVIIHETFTSAPANATAGTINTGKTNLARVRIIGANGSVIGRYDFGAAQPAGTGASVNFATGEVTITSTAGWSQPVVIEHRIEDMRIPQSVALDTGVITLDRPLSHAFSTAAKVSSFLIYGDLQGKSHSGFAQTAWTGAWSDAPIGNQPLAQFNDVLYPVEMTNAGSITERWLCLFTNQTTFNVIGEQVGVVSLGNLISEDCTPLNPATQQPYFTIPKEGWGAGWNGGNAFRFNTDGAIFPVWIARNVAPSDPVPGSDQASIQLRGDVDA